MIKLSENQAALFGFFSTLPSAEELSQWWVSDSESFVEGDWEFGRLGDGSDDFSQTVGHSPEQVEGLQALELEFQGEITPIPADSVTRESLFDSIPRKNEEEPGIKAELIPSLKSKFKSSKKEPSVLSTQASLH